MISYDDWVLLFVCSCSILVVVPLCSVVASSSQPLRRFSRSVLSVLIPRNLDFASSSFFFFIFIQSSSLYSLVSPFISLHFVYQSSELGGRFGCYSYATGQWFSTTVFGLYRVTSGLATYAAASACWWSDSRARTSIPTKRKKMATTVAFFWLVFG